MKYAPQSTFDQAEVLSGAYVRHDNVVWCIPPAFALDERQAEVVAREAFELGLNQLSIPTTDGFFVYLHLSADREVLYVGSTKSPLQRVANHVANKRKSRWFSSVTDIIWFSCSTAWDMSRVEEMFIRHFDPPYNIQSKEKPRVAPRSTDELADVDVESLMALDSEALVATLDAIAGAA